MSVNIETRPIRLSIGAAPARRIVLDGGTSRLINAGKQGVRGPAGEDGPPGAQGQPGIDAAGQIPPIPFSWGDAPADVYVTNRAGVVTVARLQFTEPFTDPAATVTVGTAAEPEAFMPAAFNAPASTYEFENTPDAPLADGEGVRLVINPGTSSAGAGLLFLTFLPTE